MWTLPSMFLQRDGPSGVDVVYMRADGNTQRQIVPLHGNDLNKTRHGTERTRQNKPNIARLGAHGKNAFDAWKAKRCHGTRLLTAQNDGEHPRHNMVRRAKEKRSSNASQSHATHDQSPGKCYQLGLAASSMIAFLATTQCSR